MSSFPSVILHHHKAHAVKRFHPWVFSGAVKKIEGQPGQGDVVNVLSDKGEFLGVGHYGAGGIAVRLFAFEKVDNLNALWKKKFEAAYNVRKAAELI
ncbi:MAG TPA: hypothetical protein VG603_12530, partial [Chitinophagales bacterium]|nr:hypothetical protein [Chitinophagales bacterium]